MKFLNTEDKMDIIEIETFSTVKIKIYSSYFDLKPQKFEEKLTKIFSDVKKVSSPVLIVLNCEELTEDEIDYYKDLLLNVMVRAFADEQINNWWSARTKILDSVGISPMSLKKLANCKVTPSIFNVVFDKSGKICYNILEKNS